MRDKQQDDGHDTDPSKPADHFDRVEDEGEVILSFSPIGSAYPCEVEKYDRGKFGHHVKLHNTVLEHPVVLTREEFNEAVEREDEDDGLPSVHGVPGEDDEE